MLGGRNLVVGLDVELDFFACEGPDSVGGVLVGGMGIGVVGIST